MKAMQRILGGGALVAALAIALSTPSLAQKLDNKNPPATTSAAALASDVDFGDDTGQWANDGECDDPRFSGTGSAVELEDADIKLTAVWGLASPCRLRRGPEDNGTDNRWNSGARASRRRACATRLQIRLFHHDVIRLCRVRGR